MEEHTEQKRVMADTYMEEVWEQQAVKNWSKPMHNFGVRQNAFNQSADQRIRALESENLQLRTQIRTLMQQTEELSQIAQRQKERLRQEEQRNREIFGRVAAMLDRMRNDLDRVRLSTQLNSNAIDRLMLEDEAEPEAVEEPLTTMEEPAEEVLETLEEAETVERFYTENGLPIEVDPTYDFPNRYNIATFPVEENDKNGEGESLKLHMNREPRFYAWIAFHNGYYEVSGEDDRKEFSYAPVWKRGKDKKYKQLVQFMKTQNMGITNDNKYGTKTGYLNKKGAHPGTSASKSTGFKVINYPWPMVRLAELYLNYAEACVECNDLPEAKRYLNYVRGRAGIPTVEESWDGIAELTQNKLREIVRQERLIELYMENHNFWDIRRWGIAETLGEQPKGLSVQAKTITEFAKPVSVDVQRRFIPAHYLMPLPISEINKNPNMVQNPGYDQ